MIEQEQIDKEINELSQQWYKKGKDDRTKEILSLIGEDLNKDV